jgi:23S rRNA pseudouridine1911/1915/1917 synthase
MSESYREVEFISEAAGERLDKALATRFSDISRAQIQILIKEGQVMVNGKVAKASYRIEGGEKIMIHLPKIEEATEPQPEAIPLDVLYEDEQVVVINKPAGMVVHPAFGHDSGTLVNAVLSRWPHIANFTETSRAGIVHRLDKETSGVIVVAKTALALASLRKQFKDREVHKKYLALVEGTPNTPDGVINAPIGRDPHQRKRMAVVRDGRESVTEFHVLQSYAENSLLEVLPQTGRTHQIRVHMAFIGNPVVGDTVYGFRKQKIKMKRHFLHAAAITFKLPANDELITVEAPLPVGLQDILNKLPE